MELFPLHIKGELFHIAIADTDELREKGLSGLKRLGKNKGMLFIFPEPVQMWMIMQDMNFPLDFVFLNNNWEVIHLGSLAQDDKNGIYPPIPCPLVLELEAGKIQELGLRIGDSLSPDVDINTHYIGVKKFKSGGKFEIIGEKVYKVKIDDVPVEYGKLQILNTHGEVVANIAPGSRIFSREHTKELIKKYKAGDEAALAEFMLHVLDIQDKQEPDYVTKD